MSGSEKRKVTLSPSIVPKLNYFWSRADLKTRNQRKTDWLLQVQVIVKASIRLFHVVLASSVKKRSKMRGDCFRHPIISLIGAVVFFFFYFVNHERILVLALHAIEFFRRMAQRKLIGFSWVLEKPQEEKVIYNIFYQSYILLLVVY